VHKSKTATPYAKGEGASQMVSDFVSADYGWLRSPDGKDEARVLFKAGKNCDGYFTNVEIIEQATKAIDILEQHFPDEDHVFFFNNAPMHLKRADGALSARKMPKGTSIPGKNWGVEVNMKDKQGKPIYGSDGKLRKKKIRMEDATFADGMKQSLYFEEGQPKAGLFKGMAVILWERGLVEESELPDECKNFKCTPSAMRCCCRWVLYNQPDFVQVEPLLETVCKVRGVQVVFLPKFHCELNFIEQCWGIAKRIYRHYPPSSKESDLTHNVITALDSVPLESMRRCKLMLTQSSFPGHLRNHPFPTILTNLDSDSGTDPISYLRHPSACSRDDALRFFLYNFVSFLLGLRLVKKLVFLL
jgi:hypothetical protein